MIVSRPHRRRAILARGIALVVLIIACHVPASVDCQLSTSPRTPRGAIASRRDVFGPTRKLLLDALDASGHSGFKALLEKSGSLSAIGGALDGAPFSVFAPSDKSLIWLPPALLASLQNPSNVATLRQVLTYHFVREKISRFAWEGPWRSVQGEDVVLHADGANFTVSDMPISKYAAAYTARFVLHTTDGLLFPPSLRARLTGAGGATGGAPQLAEVPPVAVQGEGSGEGGGSGASGGVDDNEEYEEDYEEDVWRREALQAYDVFYLYAPAPAPSMPLALPPPSTSLSAGAIAGIVIGCVAGVALAAALLYYLLVARH
ncbi:hypothetical protein CLOM_g23920 [Closterium sp. NIES-68]|nr:hypothetical protein CLOM_g23920 [Closterium sp. NIES-68]GJP86240.1 hypothetical protein CLOP_g16286 [Closterium sp. NIES-67]